MGKSYLLLIFGLVFSNATFARPTACLPSDTALDVVEIVDPHPFARPFTHYLDSVHGVDSFTTRVQLLGEVRAEIDGSDTAELSLSVQFDPEFDGVSLPYNLYALQVFGEYGEELAWLDFTSSCSGPGIGFFPGRKVELGTIKLVGVNPQRLQIIVWGKL